MTMAYALAVGTALMNAVTTILQRLGVEEAPPETTLRWSLITYAVHRKVWLAGFAGLIVAFLLQATALHYGTLSVVQPILTLELPFLVAILGFWIHKRLSWREWSGALAAAGGLAAFLALASPTPGGETPTLISWGLVSFSVVAATAVAVGLALVGSPAWRAAMFGVSAAIMYAFTASLIKQTTNDLAMGWSALFLHWHVYAMAAAGLMGVFLTQNAFHAGPVTASQAALVIVDPLVSIAIGVSLFGDEIQTSGARGELESLALIVMCAGGLFLARSPLVATVREEEDAEGGAPEPLLGGERQEGGQRGDAGGAERGAGRVRQGRGPL
jgi:drug/metabolite transporter (DMT)-like permease